MNEDIDKIEVNSTDVSGTVFLIPMGAPLPLELEDVDIATGSLVERLLPLSKSEPEDDFALVPISGSELLALTRAWNLITEASKVAVLTELPGAQYDLIFTQSKRQLGIRDVDWPSISEALGDRSRTRQRSQDTEAWEHDEDKISNESKPRQMGERSIRGAKEKLPEPEASDSEEV